jgi:hypothetical protein
VAKELDLFSQINNAVLDLQGSHAQSFDRPLKTLARLLHHSELEAVNGTLTEGIDFDAFMADSERTGRSMAGAHKFAWPPDDKQTLGLTLILIDKLAADSDFAINIGNKYFHSGNNNIVGGIHSLTRQIIIPFVRDYKTYVMSHGNVEPKLIAPTSNKVFIVHGHDEAAWQGLARFVEKLGLEAIVLQEQPDQGFTIIEKFETYAKQVGFAVVLLTPDDLGGSALAPALGARARQNVIFELGYFAGKLGRARACLLRKGAAEIPSDLYGVIYTDMDAAGGWKLKLAKELKAAEIPFNQAKVLGA